MKAPFNPAKSPGYGARLWELLRRNEEFRTLANKWRESGERFRAETEHRFAERRYVTLALEWMTRPVFKTAPSGGIERRWGPPFRTQEEARDYRPFTVKTAWPRTPARFRRAFNSLFKTDLQPFEVDLVRIVTDAEEAWITKDVQGEIERAQARGFRLPEGEAERRITERIESQRTTNLRKLAEGNVVVALPRGAIKERDLDAWLDKVREIYRRHHAAAPDYRRSFLGTEAQWECFLLAETHPDNPKEAAFEYARRHPSRKQSPPTDIARCGTTIADNKKAIEGWISNVFPDFKLMPPVTRRGRT